MNNKSKRTTQTKSVTMTISPIYKYTFVFLLAITVLSLLIACTLVGLMMNTGRAMTPQESAMFDLCTSTFKLGFGAIIGLVSGKAI